MLICKDKRTLSLKNCLIQFLPMYLIRLTKHACCVLFMMATVSVLRGSGEIRAESLLELSRMAYGLASTYEDVGRVVIEPEVGDERQQFLFRTHFSRRGPFRYEFRGETHPELILIRSDGRLTGFYWSAEDEELPVVGPYEALLRAGPATSGIARWVPMLLLAGERESGLTLLDCRTAKIVNTGRGGDGEVLYELMLDEGTPLQRRLWIDGDSYLILQVETRRTTRVGTATIRATFQPTVDESIPWEMFTEGAMPVHGDDGLVEIRQDGRLSRIPAPDEVLAIVFGTRLTIEDIYPDGLPAPEVLRNTLGVALGQLVFRDVMETFIEARNYDIPQQMVDSYVIYRVNTLRQNLQQIDEALAQGQNLDPNVVQQLQALRSQTQAALSGDSESLRAELAREGVDMVRLWKFNRDVYSRYRGRVIHSETGPEPIEAYRDLIREQMEAGRVRLLIGELETAFWSVFDPEMAYEIPTREVSFNRPWWMHGVVTVPR